jgi:hypothetical protein
VPCDPSDPLRPTSAHRRRGAGSVRRLIAAAPSGPRATQSAGSVLGATHPLTLAIEAAECAARQWLVCAAILTGAAIARLEHHTWTTAIIASSAVVSAAFTVLLIALKQRVRERAMDLIAEGRETLPITAVQRQRQRLLTHRRRKVLARALETMIRDATNPPRIITTSARPLFDVRVIAGVAGDLRAVIGLLETERVRARGVALIERLMSDGGSPLYGRDASLLREELHRVRHALED